MVRYSSIYRVNWLSIYIFDGNKIIQNYFQTGFENKVFIRNVCVKKKTINLISIFHYIPIDNV